MNPDIDKCFKILEVKRGASYKEVRNAYIDLMKVWHPDRFHGEPELREKAEFKVKEINHAHDVLKKYYQTRARQKKSQNTAYSADNDYSTENSETKQKEHAKNAEDKYKNYQDAGQESTSGYKKGDYQYNKKKMI